MEWNVGRGKKYGGGLAEGGLTSGVGAILVSEYFGVEGRRAARKEEAGVW